MSTNPMVKEMQGTLKKVDADLKELGRCLQRVKAAAAEQGAQTLPDRRTKAVQTRLQQHRETIRQWAAQGGVPANLQSQLAAARVRIESDLRKLREFEGEAQKGPYLGRVRSNTPDRDRERDAGGGSACDVSDGGASSDQAPSQAPARRRQGWQSPPQTPPLQPHAPPHAQGGQHYQAAPSEGSGASPREPQGPDAEVKITVDQLVDVEGENSATEFVCQICQTHVVGRGPKLTSCSHLFCGDCIAKWLSVQKTSQTWAGRAQLAGSVPCPVCKEPIRADHDLHLVCPTGQGGSAMLWQILSMTRVICVNNPKCRGPDGRCDWIGTYGTYQNHSAYCTNAPMPEIVEPEIVATFEPAPVEPEVVSPPEPPANLNLVVADSWEDISEEGEAAADAVPEAAGKAEIKAQKVELKQKQQEKEKAQLAAIDEMKVEAPASPESFASDPEEDNAEFESDDNEDEEEEEEEEELQALHVAKKETEDSIDACLGDDTATAGFGDEPAEDGKEENLSSLIQQLFELKVKSHQDDRIPGQPASSAAPPGTLGFEAGGFALGSFGSPPPSPSFLAPAMYPDMGLAPPEFLQQFASPVHSPHPPASPLLSAAPQPNMATPKAGAKDGKKKQEKQRAGKASAKAGAAPLSQAAAQKAQVQAQAAYQTQVARAAAAHAQAHAQWQAQAQAQAHAWRAAHSAQALHSAAHSAQAAQYHQARMAYAGQVAAQWQAARNAQCQAAWAAQV